MRKAYNPKKNKKSRWRRKKSRILITVAAENKNHLKELSSKGISGKNTGTDRAAACAYMNDTPASTGTDRATACVDMNDTIAHTSMDRSTVRANIKGLTAPTRFKGASVRTHLNSTTIPACLHGAGMQQRESAKKCPLTSDAQPP